MTVINYKYLIIGGGMTADATVQGIREIDTTGSIGIISAETDPPYERPPLTKGLWKDDLKVEDIFLNTASHQVDLILNQKVTKINSAEQTVQIDQGNLYHYEKLLLATGGKPRRLKNDIPEVIYYRTIGDYRKVLDFSTRYQNFVIIGGGFIGAEMATALTLHKKKVIMIFPEIGIGGLIFPKSLTTYLNSYFKKKGVSVISEELVSGLTKQGNKIIVTTNKNRKIETDCVIAGIGIIPNTELAESIGIKVNNGIEVDEFCRTSDPHIFAAGDVANFYNDALKKRMRVEHEDNAKTMGLLAGKNMAGAMEPYTHQSYFYSDLFDHGYEAVGDLNPNYDTFIDWFEDNESGVIYYLDQQRIVGVLLWGVFEQIDTARDLIHQNKRYKSKKQLKSLITPTESSETPTDEEEK